MKSILKILFIFSIAVVISFNSLAFDPNSSCYEIERYFKNNQNALSSIEGAWSSTVTITQRSFLYNEPNKTGGEATWYIVNTGNGNFSVYSCDRGRLKSISTITRINAGSYIWEWTLSPFKYLGTKQFSIKRGNFSINYVDIPNNIKTKMFQGIGSAVKVTITIEAELLAPDDY